MVLDLGLPGRLVLRRGCAGDYEGLARFHYRGRRPATWAGVWVAEYFSARDGGGVGRVVGVGVLSYPTLAMRVREEVLGLRGMGERERIGFVNENVRTISRVVVHPQFRSVGLAVALVCCLISHCDTRYVEALAVMGRAHPLFEKAGMRRVHQSERNGRLPASSERNGRLPASGEGRPVYYWCERR
jgi:GNAT superfamily N-acetyltransferase